MATDLKELLFSLTKKDFRIETFRGSGKGGQKRNKTETAVRITHEPSGGTAYSDVSRSQHNNKKDAFLKLSEDPVFTTWLRRETARHLGKLAGIDEEVDRQMRDETLIETFDPDR